MGLQFDEDRLMMKIGFCARAFEPHTDDMATLYDSDDHSTRGAHNYDPCRAGAWQFKHLNQARSACALPAPIMCLSLPRSL